MSTRWSGGCPCACSGDMYSGVPKIIPVLRQARRVRSSSADHLGDAEVEHLDEVGPPVALDEVDVLGLHVAVDDAAARARPAAPWRSASGSGARAATAWAASVLMQLAEVLPVEVLHGEEDEPVGVWPKSVMSMMFSWPIREALFASCRKRATRSARRVRSWNRTLSATFFSMTRARPGRRSPCRPRPSCGGCGTDRRAPRQ